MNIKLEAFKKEIKDKKVAVLGIGVSNTPLIKFLYSMGAKITAFDKAPKEKIEDVLKTLENCNIEYSLGEEYLQNLKGFDVIFRTPGMRPDFPEILKETENGAKLISEMELFLDLCEATVFAITGSDGKTTTTSIIYNMLKEEGYKTWLGGNIGNPLLSKIEEVTPEDYVVLELSSFQLMTMTQSPQVAVVTNVTPNHLDVHKSMDEYVDAKRNIFKYQSTESRDGKSPKVVLNYDNDIARLFGEEASNRAVFFSRNHELKNGAVLEDGKIKLKGSQGTDVVNIDEIIIPGIHNVENYMAAMLAVEGYVSVETMKKVAKTFAGVAHRIELVREINGVKFYNDSIASSPNRTMAGLNAFNKKVILIAGGKDKKIPYDDMGPVLAEKVKHLLLIGQTGPKIQEALTAEIERTGKGKEIVVETLYTYPEVVKRAYEIAKPGDVVILSPASTSFDMFKNFEERGNIFKELVMKL